MIDDLVALSARSQWLNAPQGARDLAESLLPLAIKVATSGLSDFVAVWYCPDKPLTLVESPSTSLETLGKLGELLEAPVVLNEPATLPTAVRLASGSIARPPHKAALAQQALFDYLASTGLLEALGTNNGLAKAASDTEGYSPLLRHWSELAGYSPGGQYSWDLPGVPRHLQGMLGGGLIGAGLGYGAGWLGSQILPQSWDRGRLRRNAMLAGAGLGMLPGAMVSLGNYGLGKPPGDDSFFQTTPSQVMGRAEKSGAQNEPAGDILAANSALHVEIPAILKAASETGVDEMTTELPIPVDNFSQIIWGDPRVANQLSVPQRAAASGLVNAALLGRARAGGDATRFIYPEDIGRIAMGMGTGYLSGALVGKVLGSLIGMPESTQDRLKSTGAWAGIIANALPIVFGG